MGSSPSKANEVSRPNDNHIQDSSKPRSSSCKDQSILSEKSARREEEKEMETVSAMSATPRARTKSNKSTDQSRGNRQAKEGRDDVHRRSHITDEQVHVNLAMADLMAYLQVVANNSNNLPLTRRDDPELSRMVTNLTTEEYARKSAAFIPADVRVIGGSFTKYGNVWDLPTSDEYNAQDGAQEPGRSYGGACSNAMLKVLYDAANEAADSAQSMKASDALFDDDEEEDNTLSNGPTFNRNTTFASIDMNEHYNPSTISWASLMRKMKAEIKDIEYAQVPTLTTTRKFDLNQPFSLVPNSFDLQNGKRRSLLIGCNYKHINGAQLKASHDDVRSMKDYIVNVHGFPESDDMMTILLDDDDHKHPTFLNVTEAFKALSEQSQPGDSVFIHFSGHGGRVLDSDGDTESYGETIVPSDYNTCGLIRDTLIFKTLLAPMRYGVTVTILIDACDTGMVLDLPYSWSNRADRSGTTVKMTQNDDFSFVRFLKVIKTLYESSTFTQLGKTVGSALDSGNVQKEAEQEDDDTYEYTAENSKDSRTSRPEDDSARNEAQTQLANPIMNIFGACGTTQAEESQKASSKEDKERKEVDQMTVDTRELLRPPVSLLEQMINCTFGQEVDDADDASQADTYANSHGTPSFSEPELDDSTYYSDDDTNESSKRGRRGRSRRPRN